MALSATSSRQPQPSRTTSITGRYFCMSSSSHPMSFPKKKLDASLSADRRGQDRRCVGLEGTRFALASAATAACGGLQPPCDSQPLMHRSEEHTSELQSP